MESLATPLCMPVQELGSCLKQILREKGISASELARMMACKSRNSIFRILDGKGSYGVQKAFYDRLTGEDPLGLIEDERAALKQALEVSRVGIQGFLNNRAMRGLLMSGDMQTQKARIDARLDNRDPGFHRALDRMARGKKAYLTITGCCDRGVFEALRERIYMTDAACEVKVVHLVYTGEEGIIHNLMAIQPLLYCDFYTAYCVEPGMLSEERERLYRSNTIYVHGQDEDGKWYDYVFVLVDKGVFVPIHSASNKKQDLFMAYFGDEISRLPQLKEVFSADNAIGDYLNYTLSCMKLEHGREIYTIRKDVPLSYVHTDILLPCAREAFAQMAQGETLEELINGLERVHRARWDNLFGKKKATHTVFSVDAMEEFARTGRQSDHFFALRAYTPCERVIILENLKRHVMENAAFQVYFFHPGFVPPLTEAGLYVGVGTLLTKPDTHYNLAADHAEVIVTQDEFCRRYKEFYINDLLEHYVMDKQQTLDTFDHLIEIAKQA